MPFTNKNLGSNNWICIFFFIFIVVIILMNKGGAVTENKYDNPQEDFMSPLKTSILTDGVVYPYYQRPWYSNYYNHPYYIRNRFNQYYYPNNNTLFY